MKPGIGACILSVSFVAALPNASAQQAQVTTGTDDHRFRVTSTTFTDGAALPLSTVWNQCTAYPGGGNLSPQLAWSNAPRGTRSFIVIAYDVTASFTHWGMYNISPKAAGLPQNAGVAGSSYGLQVSNDFGDLSYDGPCPPTTLNPPKHHYVFTVYALDTMLPQLPSFGDFPPGAEALYHALIVGAWGEHVLDSASIGGFFGSSP